MNKWYEFKATASGEETELLLYGEIGGWGISAESFMAALKQVPANHRINLRIYSPGGSVFDGNVIFNALQRHPGGVVTHIDGLAASMASVVALAGKPVKMASNALYMIHNVSGGAHGDAEDLRKTADLIEKIQQTIVDAYTKRTGKSADEIAKMMDEETWFTAAEAKEHGFVDEVTEEVKMAATFDLSGFKKAPRIDTTNKQTSQTMIIETPEYLDLQAKHGELTKAHALAEATIATLKNDLECAAQANKDLVAKAAEVSTKLSEKDAEIETLKAAQSDFDAKVELAAQAKMAALGAPPAAINPSVNAETDAELYERFKAANSIESNRLLQDPNTGPRIRRESAKRHA